MSRIFLIRLHLTVIFVEEAQLFGEIAGSQVCEGGLRTRNIWNSGTLNPV